MGDAHFRSNIKGESGAETISNFQSFAADVVTGTTVVARTSVTTGSVVNKPKGIVFGTGCCVVTGTLAKGAAAMNNAASALCGVPLRPGCIYLSNRASLGGAYVRQTKAASWTRILT